MTVLVTASSDAANQRAQPRAPVDAMHGAATVPLGLLGKHQIIEIEVWI
jgi:hypothetical protein